MFIYKLTSCMRSWSKVIQGSRLILPTGRTFATNFLSWSLEHIIWSHFFLFFWYNIRLINAYWWTFIIVYSYMVTKVFNIQHVLFHQYYLCHLLWFKKRPLTLVWKPNPPLRSVRCVYLRTCADAVSLGSTHEALTLKAPLVTWSVKSDSCYNVPLLCSTRCMKQTLWISAAQTMHLHKCKYVQIFILAHS